MDDEQLQPAAEQIVEILGELQDDATGKLLDSASESLRGAQDALRREAWPVLVAELDQLEAILDQRRWRLNKILWSSRAASRQEAGELPVACRILAIALN